jgi:periplasmic glucans biosynthesis protein
MITRRVFLSSGVSMAALTASSLRLMAQADNLSTPDALIASARRLAQAPYAPRRGELVPPFDTLDYDSFRGVRPRKGTAAGLQLGTQFRADLLPPGWLFQDHVSITLPGHDTTFSAKLFDLDPTLIAVPDGPIDYAGMGFSGIRFQTPLNEPDIWDEVLVLQGASYFRALASGTAYGLSARALALNTGGPGIEEFPITRHITVFDTAEGLHFGCLIDTPRASAALIATLRPGRATVMDCALHLFPRVPLADVGIAPLTSMFQHNDLGPARIDDFRPAVHDSDVLVIDNGAGERLWRPLANPAQLVLSAFSDDSPRGFGLLQGPTAFDRYRDAEAAYHRRPSAWVEPAGDWGRGAVMLLEIPTENEFADNIVAFWRPERVLDTGAHKFDYRLSWLAPGLPAFPTAPLPLVPLHAASGVEPNTGAARLFVLDYHLDPTQGRTADDYAQSVVLDFGPVSGAQINGEAVYALREDPSLLRVSFVLTPDADTSAVELRLALRNADTSPLAPIWLYRWSRRVDGKV